MANKKNSSCLALFFKAFLISSLVLANLVALTVMIGLKFLDFDAHLWTDLSNWNSRPFIALYLILGLSGCFGIVFGLAGAAISAVFGRSEKKSSPGPRKRSKPQSNRRTTI